MNTDKVKSKNGKLPILGIISRLFKTKYWIVKKCGYPYDEGYATYNWKTHTVLDTGLSKEEAKAICRELNHKN